MLENGLALKRSKRGQWSGGLDSPADRLVNRRLVGQRHPGGHRAGVLVRDRQLGVRGAGFVRQVIGITLAQQPSLLPRFHPSVFIGSYHRRKTLLYQQGRFFAETLQSCG